MNRSLIPRLAGLILIIALPTILPCPALAQSPMLAVDKVAGLPGTSVDVGINLTAGASAVSSLQFDLTFATSRISYVSAATGAAASAAGKDTITAATSSGVRVIVFGLNRNTVGTGPVAVMRLMISAASAAGTVTIGISSVAGAGPDGQTVSVTGTSGSVTVNMPADTTPPVISGVATSGITQSAAKVAWTTDELSDTQVEYGTTSAYGKTTLLDSSQVKTHSQTLTGLVPSTEYHYRVKSKDAGGNLAVSGDFAFATTAVDTAALTITNVAASGITQSTATITWATSEAADTQVEYGLTTSYGQKTTLISTMSTSHSQTLTDLTPQTPYHYRVKSKNAAGNPAVSGDFSFTTADSEPDTESNTTLYLPTFSLDRSALGIAGFWGSGFTGVALANLSAVDARLMFTALNPNGNHISGDGVTNPAQRALNRGGQLPIVDTQIFGTAAGPVGWMKVDSTVSKISSFFMAFDSNLTVLDGANASIEPVSTAILPEVGENGFNRIFLGNPGSDPVSVTLNLMKSDGTVRAGTTRGIEAAGAIAADLYSDIFPQAVVDRSDYLRITAAGPAVPYELLAEAGKDIRILSGQNAALGAAQLYSPQYVVGGPWRSTISIVNLESRAATVTMHFVPDDLSKAEKTVQFEIAANGKLYVSDQRIFLDPGTDLTKTITQGWIGIASDGARLIGSVTFGNSGLQKFASALPLVAELDRNVIFSHAASNTTWFTGIALLNPGSTSAQTTIDLYGADGTREATVTATVPAKGRRSQLLTELFPALAGKDRTSGYIRVTSDWPLASFALFGTNSLSVLSAIPAQPAP